jgi:hypothetical protein
MRNIYILFCLSLIYSWGTQAQKTPDDLVIGLKEKMSEVTGFVADAIIHVDIDFIEIKDRQVKIKYTAPDKFEFDAQGIALLPKNGMKMEYLSMVYAENIVLPAGEETIRKVQTQKIKVIPETIDSDIVLAQLWMDPLTYRIMRMQTFTRDSGSYLIDFYFQDDKSILPIKIEVTFDIENLSAPAQMITEFMGKSNSERDSLPKEAKVIVTYKNMEIFRQIN